MARWPPEGTAATAENAAGDWISETGTGFELVAEMGRSSAAPLRYRKAVHGRAITEIDCAGGDCIAEACGAVDSQRAGTGEREGGYGAGEQGGPGEGQD